jgi:hypothetical protein
MINAMIALENESDRFIQREMFYIVSVYLHPSLKKDSLKDKEKIFDLAGHLLYSEPRPLALYTNFNEILMIFDSCLEGEEPPYKGSHHRIVSRYCSIITQALPPSVIKNGLYETVCDVRIIEIKNKISMVTYLGYILFQTGQNQMKLLSGGAITDNLLCFRTSAELQELFLSKTGMAWDQIDLFDRYGIIMKLQGKKILKRSGPYDSRDNESLLNFIFN